MRILVLMMIQEKWEGQFECKSLQLGLESQEEERTNLASGSLSQVNWQMVIPSLKTETPMGEF